MKDRKILTLDVTEYVFIRAAKGNYPCVTLHGRDGSVAYFDDKASINKLIKAMKQTKKVFKNQI